MKPDASWPDISDWSRVPDARPIFCCKTQRWEERAVAARRRWFMRSKLAFQNLLDFQIAECNPVIPRARRWRYAAVGLHTFVSLDTTMGPLMPHAAPRKAPHSCYREDAELGERAVADRAALPTTREGYKKLKTTCP